MKDTTKIVTSFAAVPNEKHIIWRIVWVARNLAARGTSALEAKGLTTGPPVVPYVSVIGGRAFLHIAPHMYRDT